MPRKTKGKRNAKNEKTSHARPASRPRTEKRKPARANRPKGIPSRASVPKRAAPAPRNTSGGNPRRRGAASFRLQPKRTFQVTDTLAKERVRFQAGKGRKLKSSSETARAVLLEGAKRAKKKFSRKGSGRYAARITLKWKSKNGKWIKRDLVHVAPDLEAAIEGLLQHEEINSLTYETSDAEGDTEIKKIDSKTKRIERVSFDKYSDRQHKPGWKQKSRGKVPKAAKAKTVSKKPRNVRHRK